MTEQVVKSKDLRRQTKEWMAVFSQTVLAILSKKLYVSICAIIPQNRKVKKFQLHIIDQSFEHNGIWIIVDETTYKGPAPKTLDDLRQ